MPGFKMTPFETHLIKSGFIDKEGKVIKGCLSTCNIYVYDMGRNKNGDLMLQVGPELDLLGKESMIVIVPQKDISLYMQVQNLTEALIYDTMVKNIVEPITRYISTTVVKMTKEIYEKEDEASNGALANGTLTRRERKEFAKNFFIDENFDTPQEIYDEFNKTPMEFLRATNIMTNVASEMFKALKTSSKNFGTPEEIVAFRAVTTQTVLNFMEIAEDRGLSDTPFHENLMKFDDNLEKVGEKV